MCTGGIARRERSCSSCSPGRSRPGGRFLDVGCGTGATGRWLAEHGDLVAVDFEPQALTLFGERHASIGLVAADAGRLPLADGRVRRCRLRHGPLPPVDREPAAVVRELGAGRAAGRRGVPVGAGREAPRPRPRPGDAHRASLLAPRARRLRDGGRADARAFDRRLLVPRPGGGGQVARRARRGRRATSTAMPVGSAGVLGGLASAERRLLAARRSSVRAHRRSQLVGRKAG